MCLLYHPDNEKAICYKIEARHDHHDHEGRGINGNVNEITEELYNDGVVKLKQIIIFVDEYGTVLLEYGAGFSIKYSVLEFL